MIDRVAKKSGYCKDSARKANLERWRRPWIASILSTSSGKRLLADAARLELAPPMRIL
jgi:hypothetical protein